MDGFDAAMSTISLVDVSVDRQTWRSNPTSLNDRIPLAYTFFVLEGIEEFALVVDQSAPESSSGGPVDSASTNFVTL